MWEILILGLLAGGVLAMIAVGLTLIFGVMDIVNFAHGEFVMLGMLGTATVTTAWSVSPYVAGLVVLAAAVPVALVLYFVVIVPTLGRSLYVQVFGTLGLSIVLQAGALIIFGPDTRAITDDFTATRINVLGAPVEMARVVAFAGAVIFVGLLWFVLTRTRLGYEVRAVSQDTDAARIIGVRVNRIYTLVFLAGALLAVTAGILISPFQSSTPYSGVNYALMSFVIVVLGGFGSVSGALAGGLLVGVIEAFAGYYLGAEWSQASLFLLFMGMLLARPSGLFGTRTVDSKLEGAH